MTIIQAIILGIVEGLTEFLPISSTGHMIIASAIMGIEENDFVKMFEVVIQFGAILAVIILYWKRFVPRRNIKDTFNFYLKLLLAFIPAAIFGLLLKDKVDQMLGSVMVVAISLFLGGIVLLFIDRIFRKTEEGPYKPITNAMAFKIGCFQVISLIPGVSRSAATIIGGLTQKLNRKQAAEFSFFLAVPTMGAATLFDFLDYYKTITHDTIGPLLIGIVVSFIVAIVTIRAFISFLTKHGFLIFGIYRIIVGAIILILLSMGKHLFMQ
ncbi:MAG: undecaprenyl-diphosphate phosphatase [Chitinophagales bacterium]|nr:undecaprenyl-diphosphate phosphatase [Chitinophagales bacterium]